MFYADDITLLAPDEQKVLIILDDLNRWCIKWRLAVNQKKTKIHLRNKSVPISNYQFKSGDMCPDFASCYKYLVVVEFSDYAVTA